MRPTTTTAKFIGAHPDGVPRLVIVDEVPATVIAALPTGELIVRYHGAEFESHLQADDVFTFDTDDVPTRVEYQTTIAEADARRHGTRRI